jgi:hypothetical protein
MSQKCRSAAPVVKLSAALRCAYVWCLIGLPQKTGNHSIELLDCHRLAQQKSLTRVATESRQELKISRRRHADGGCAATKVMRDLDDGLADVGVCRNVSTPLYKRAIYLDLGERYSAYGFETERPSPEIVDRYRGAAFPKLWQARLQRLILLTIWRSGISRIKPAQSLHSGRCSSIKSAMGSCNSTSAVILIEISSATPRLWK